LAGKHRNLYLSLSGIIGWLAHSPYRGYHMIGTALQWVTDDKIVMGLDLAFDDMGKAVDYIRNLQIPEELRQQWGYPEITDSTRAKILGLNLAGLAGIPTKKLAPQAGAKSNGAKTALDGVKAPMRADATASRGRKPARARAKSKKKR
jgi:hypothetical protein